ncbi:MAG: DUF3806 domain-containing protein [Paludibacteraceae bacterium]|nr:DUF3806 domain-containing protein [Paludibacteraceae bacterium]
MEQRIEELTEQDVKEIAERNDWVKGHLQDDAQDEYNTLEGKFHLLQGILRNGYYQKDETMELQTLGFCLGEMLNELLGTHWVKVTDDHGTDFAIRYKDSSIILFPVTMISKRVERDEEVDIELLLVESNDHMSEILYDELSEKCHYYAGEDEFPADADERYYDLWAAERAWFEFEMQHQPVIDEYVKFYRANGLADYHKEDGTPESLKALLFNSYSYAKNGVVDIPGFKRWYEKEYLQE